MARLGLIGAMGAVAIEQTRTDIRQIAVPDLVRALGQGIAPQFALALGIEQAEFDPVGIGRIDGEINPFAIEGRPQRMGRRAR